MIDAARLAKFRRRAPLITSQDHLDRAMFGFPAEHHEAIAAQIQPLLTATITARKVDALPELKIKDPDNPTPQELTVQRLNAMAVEIDRVKSARLPLLEQIANLKAQVEAHVETIAALTSERDTLNVQARGVLK